MVGIISTGDVQASNFSPPFVATFLWESCQQVFSHMDVEIRNILEDERHHRSIFADFTSRLISFVVYLEGYAIAPILTYQLRVHDAAQYTPRIPAILNRLSQQCNLLM